jgi:hypothetical protein
MSAIWCKADDRVLRRPLPLSGRCLTPVWGDPTEEASDVVAEGLRARMSDLKRRLVPFPKSNSIEIDRAQGGAGCK